MSRSFIQDQELIDRLMTDDTEAFEELYRRHWYNLYSYSMQKLHDSGRSRRVVRNLFIRLWEMRKTFPVDFVLSEFFYTEVRKEVVVQLDSQLNAEIAELPEALAREFTVSELGKARKPVEPIPARRAQPVLSRQQPRLFVTLSHVKWLFQSVTAKIL